MLSVSSRTRSARVGGDLRSDAGGCHTPVKIGPVMLRRRDETESLLTSVARSARLQRRRRRPALAHQLERIDDRFLREGAALVAPVAHVLHDARLHLLLAGSRE